VDLKKILFELLFTPRSGLERFGVIYLGFKIINGHPYAKNVIHIHTWEIIKLNRVKPKSHHGCETGGVQNLFLLFLMQ
jgi:hypothetical protein